MSIGQIFQAPASIVAATVTFTASAIDPAASSSTTFTSQAIGTAAANRKVVVGFTAHNNASGILTAVTVGGVSATALVQFNAADTADAELWIASVPTGTTGDIVLTGQHDGCGISVWATYGASSTAHATATSESTGTMTLNVNTVAGGITIGYSTFNTATAIAWTGITEDDETNMEYAVLSSGASLANATASTPLAITSAQTGGTGSASAGVTASIGPA